ncbi:ribonuclease H-like domain-containing protein [Desulfobacula sp.]|uniref:ribonuclease H-like domain-containing protein n=1 Tax=Desulfobacula sp. TaxID=2593537 RepID=UPI00261BF21F|nr:ribonuclease H-like domain-containing protein [Desulfobacula sp.]
MLINTFIHIPGIGPVTEKKIWRSNIFNWKADTNFSGLNLSASKIKDIKTFAAASNQHLENNNPGFFEALLPSNQHFRLFPEFRPFCAYLDIETTGLSSGSHITTIALYNGRQITYYVHGKNLDQFLDDIQNYSVLITYNGRSFDIPFIEGYFNITLPHAQIDLRYILKHLGFKGGLKKCEKALNIDRQDLEGVDGYFAVLLWNEYTRNGNPKALETLLAYNIEDVINLETLMIEAYNLNIRKTPFYASHEIKKPTQPENPFKADLKTIDRLKYRYY